MKRIKQIKMNIISLYKLLKKGHKKLIIHEFDGVTKRSRKVETTIEKEIEFQEACEVMFDPNSIYYK